MGRIITHAEKGKGSTRQEAESGDVEEVLRVKGAQRL